VEVSRALNEMRLKHHETLLRALEPTIADGKREGAVVAGIVRAQAGARKMAEFDFKQQGSLLFHENVRSEGRSGCEIHVGRISGRNIAGTEDDAALRGEVRDDFFPARKIPFPDGRLETASINGALRRKDNIDGHHVDGPFEIAAKNAGEMVGSKDASCTAARIKELGGIGIAQAHATAAK